MYTPHAFPGVSPGEQYDSNANGSLLVVVQLESRSGVENVEKIAAVDGVDVLFIGMFSLSSMELIVLLHGWWAIILTYVSFVVLGPFDLAKQMGVERGGEEHEAAIARILKAAKGAGKTAAFFCELTFKPSVSPRNYLSLRCVLVADCLGCNAGTNGAEAKRRLEQGFDMVSIVTDTNILGDGIAREINAAKGLDSEGKKQSGY